VIIHDKNYDTVFKYVKVMARILVASFWTRCICCHAAMLTRLGLFSAKWLRRPLNI